MNRVSVFLVLLCGLSILSAQDYNQLLKQKERLIQEAKELTKNLEETQDRHRHTIEALEITNQQLDVQKGLLGLFQAELKFLDLEMTKTTKKLEVLLIDLESNKKKYSELIQQANQLSITQNKLTFFLSANSFNQLIRRIYHFQKIAIDRSNRHQKIQELKKEVETSKELILEKKEQTIDLATEKRKQIYLLNQIQNNKQKSIDYLKTKEDSLLNVLKTKEAESNKISKAIELILQKQNEKNQLTPELALISADFKENKGALPWPTETGRIVSKFGERPHPILSGITVMNNGIEIVTTKKQVRSVFDGEVTKIIILPNGLKVIIIRHGEYFTVYSNLYDTSVKKGDQIQTKQVVGMLYSGTETNSKVLGFQIWKIREKLNPTNWLSSY